MGNFDIIGEFISGLIALITDIVTQFVTLILNGIFGITI